MRRHRRFESAGVHDHPVASCCTPGVTTASRSRTAATSRPLRRTPTGRGTLAPPLNPSHPSIEAAHGRDTKHPPEAMVASRCRTGATSRPLRRTPSVAVVRLRNASPRSDAAPVLQLPPLPRETRQAARRGRPPGYGPRPQMLLRRCRSGSRDKTTVRLPQHTHAIGPSPIYGFVYHHPTRRPSPTGTTNSLVEKRQADQPAGNPTC